MPTPRSHLGLWPAGRGSFQKATCLAKDVSPPLPMPEQKPARAPPVAVHFSLERQLRAVNSSHEAAFSVSPRPAQSLAQGAHQNPVLKDQNHQNYPRMKWAPEKAASSPAQGVPAETEDGPGRTSQSGLHQPGYKVSVIVTIITSTVSPWSSLSAGNAKILVLFY